MDISLNYGYYTLQGFNNNRFLLSFPRAWPKGTSSFNEPLEIHLELPPQPDLINWVSNDKKN
jgi:hypothetical protein